MSEQRIFENFERFAKTSPWAEAVAKQKIRQYLDSQHRIPQVLRQRMAKAKGATK